MANNLDIQLQLNQLLTEQNKLLESSAKIIKDQVSLTQNLVSAMKSANFKDVASSVEDTSRAVEEASQKSKEFGSTNQDVFDKVNSSLKEALEKETATGKGMDILTKQVKRFSVAASSIDGFVQGLRFTSNMIKTVTGAGLGLVESLGQIAVAIISIPFKMLKGLLTMADAGGADTALAQALENIRKEFGSLRETSGRAIVDMAKNMKGELSQTGLGVTRIFGNMAERLATLQEYAHNLGPLFANLSKQFVANAESIGAYYKGLGLTDEAQKAVATRAYALGTAVTEELRQVTNYSQQLSKAFNGAAGSAKEISRDMGTLMADFKHFGGIAIKEIGQAVTYFRRLGVEVSKVMGVIERYDNFTDAAEGAAQLSQAFGLNVDALEMMKAQNPAERVEQLRKAFFQAGRSVESMTRQERTLLAQQTGLEDSALDLVFSMKNQGMTYDQVTKKADAAKKSQLTQTQAMKALADSIERLVKSGSFGKGGFFDRFIQGFTVGIQRSSEFRKIMRELRIDLRTAYYEGIKVGRAFVDMFPGVKDVFKGIGDLFEPRKFRAMFSRITETFKVFFKDMTDNPKTALPKLLEHLKDDFFSWFGNNSPNSQRILDGFKKFFVALSNIAGGMLKIAMTTLTKGLREVTDIITGRKGLGGAGGAASGAQSFVAQLLGPIVDAIKEAGPGLWNATKEMFSALWVKVEPWVKENFMKVIGALAAPAFVGMAGRAISTSIAGAFATGLMNWAQSGGISKAFNSVKGMFATQVSAASQAMSKLPIPPAGGFRRAAAGVIKGAEQAATAASTSKVNWGAALVKMAAITLFITVGMAGILYAIFRFAKAMEEKKLSVQSIAAAAGAMITTATSMLAIAGAVKLLSAINLNAGMVGKIAIGVAMIGVVGAAMAYATVGLIKLFGNIETSKITKSVLVMGAMGTFFLAASAVVAIAGVIGLAATAGGGVGALVITAGLAMIAASIAVMTVQGMAIMRAIDNFRPGPGFADKAKIFVEVMKGIGQFTANVAVMIAATTPSFFEFIRGSGAKRQRETLKQVETLINVLGGQIVRIVDAIRTNVQGLTGSEQQMKSAQIIGDLLSGISGLANALKPPSEALAEPSFLQGLEGDSVARRISLMTDYVSEVGNKLSQFVRTVVATVTRRLPRGFTEAQAKAAQVIPSILAGVGDMAQALRPSASLLAEMNRGAQFHGVVQHMSNFIRKTMRSITASNLFAKIGDLLKSVATSVQSLNPEQTKALQAIAPAIGPIFTTIASIGSIISGLASGRGGGDTGLVARATPADAGTIFQMTNLVNTFFARVKDDLPVLVNNMRTAFAGISVREAQNLSRGMQAMQSLFQVISGIPQFIQSFRGSAGEQGAGGMTTLRDITHTMNLLLVALLGPGGSNGLLSVIRTIVPQVNSVADVIGNPAAFTGKLNAMKAAFDTIGQIPQMIQSLSRVENIATVTENVANQIERVQFARIATVVTDMVSHVNQLSATIRGIRPIEVEQSLQRLGDSIGLGSQGEYTIQNRNFTVNVNVTIKLDNNGLDALELAMLRRVGPHRTRIDHGSLER
ncbi:MAG: hypothetical protein E6R04_02305 [Spirochaetes bacterium]|nr:MAG: hypothetical protein E6R04_02305 [Spirochaetota bacterium]